MKHTLLPLFFMMLFSPLSWGQLSIDHSSLDVDLNVDEQKEITTVLTNNSTSTITVGWVRTENMPEGWISFVCDPVQCYLPSTDSAEFLMEPESSIELKFTFEASAEGTGTAILDVAEVGNESNSISTTYNLTSSTTTSSEDLVSDLKDPVEVYPNPTSDYIHLSHVEGISKMEIYNIIGKRLRSFYDVDDSTPYNVADLDSGMYLVRLLDEDGNEVATRRISKR